MKSWRAISLREAILTGAISGAIAVGGVIVMSSSGGSAEPVRGGGDLAVSRETGSKVPSASGSASSSLRIGVPLVEPRLAETSPPSAYQAPAAIGPAPTAAPVLSLVPVYGPALEIVAPAGNVPWPVVFQPLPQDARLTPEQQARLNAIQDRFVIELGGLSSDPTSELYKDRWRRAQRASDDLYKATFGQDSFMRRMMAAVRTEAAQKQP